MNSANKKKLSRASGILQEVAEFLEDRAPEEFDIYGQRLLDLADEIEAVLAEIEENEPEPGEDDGYQVDED